MKIQIIATVGLSLGAIAHAGPRSSTNYNVPTDTTDAGGRRGTSTSYTHDGSVGGVTGISTVAAPAGTAKSGYIGQLYEVSGLQLAATPASVDEGATRQLGAALLLDDATSIAVPAGNITWSVQSGPLGSISTGGLANAGVVYQDTVAIAQGSHAGKTGTLNLTVLDLLPDNYGSYAGDGLDDSWQNQYFGLNNPNAAPTIDADHDGQNNSFEFIAGLIPTDAASRFSNRIEAVTSQPLQKRIIFGPRLSGRTYSILTSTTLAGGSWAPLPGGVTTDNGNERTITDPNATTAAKFYQVKITKP